ncbi:MAG: RNA polymerase sporulation sigma factor SigE [Eubacteriales bacterium]
MKFLMKLVFTFRMLLSKLFMRIRSGVYYIGGTDTLPPPLTHEQEAEVIARLDSEPELRGVLVEHNLRLVVYIAKKFENTGIGIEDLISIGTIGLMKAIKTFLPDKNIKLATYASRCIENEILMFIRKTTGLRGEISIDEPLSVDWDGNELLLSDIISCEEDSVSRSLEQEEDKRIIREAVSRLDERERAIIELRFGLNTPPGEECHELTQKEVAVMLGISQSYISRLEKKILDRLGQEMTALI